MKTWNKTTQGPDSFAVLLWVATCKANCLIRIDFVRHLESKSMTLFDAAEVRSGEQLQVKVKVSNLWFTKEDNLLGGNVCAQNVHL